MEAFFFGVAVAVGLTPEMLPVIVNTNLARGAAAMSGEKVVVKQMGAIQNLGAMDVLCTDKTGTLTQDRVVLIKHLDPRGNDSERVLEHAYLNSLFQSGLKNLIDRAVIERAQNARVRELAGSFAKIDELPFDFTRRRMSVVLRPATGGPNFSTAKERSRNCFRPARAWRTAHKSCRSMSTREKLLRLRDGMNKDGLRILGVGYRAVEPGAAFPTPTKAG